MSAGGEGRVCGKKVGVEVEEGILGEVGFGGGVVAT